MDDHEKKTLNKNRRDLCEHIQINDELLTSLHHKGLITENMVSTIKDEKHNNDKVGKLLDLIMHRKGQENVFNKFTAIVDNHYPVMGKKLQEGVKEETKHGLRREATDDTSGSGMHESRHDSDIKSRVGVITHKIFGISRKMSERDKRSIEKWLGDQMQTERNYWKDEMERNARELEKKLWPKMYDRIQRTNTKLKDALHIQNGVSEPELESSGTENDEVITLENYVDRLLIKLRMAHDERNRCLDVMKVPPNSQHHRLEQLIMVVKRTYKEKMYQIQKEGEERSERLEGELQCYAEHIRDLEDSQKKMKAQIEQLEKDLREMKIEKSKIEEKCANVERHNIQLQETDLKILRLQNSALEERCATLERLTAKATNTDPDSLKRSIQDLQKQFDQSQIELKTYRKIAEQNNGARFQRVATLALAQHKTHVPDKNKKKV